MDGCYGGLFIEPVIFPKFPIHVTFPIIIGLGNFTNHSFHVFDNGHIFKEYATTDDCTFGIIEPGIEIEVNVFKFIRIGLSAKYRITSDISFDNDLPETYDKRVLWRFSYNLSLKFGKF